MPTRINNEILRKIPSTHQVLSAVLATPWANGFGREQLVEGIRLVTEEIRGEWKRGGSDRGVTVEEIADRVRVALFRRSAANLRPVINATGTILHTNLGRAPLPSESLDELRRVSEGYCNLEIDLASGDRSERYAHVEERLTRLTGAEGALVVNNDAAAVLLILDTFAHGKEVVVSRGELIEIGGAFRLPDIMARSGARLVEVGTTNRTYLADYERAITPETALLFKAHTSNYAIIGFTASPTSAELAELGRSRGIPTVEDIGNGLLVDLAPLGLGHRGGTPDHPRAPGEAWSGARDSGSREPLVQEQVAAGISLVAWSGDKLLGGPQAGVIVGRREHIDRLKHNPLTRALRIDKLHVSALEAVLRCYEEGRWRELPLHRMLLLPPEVLKRRARRLVDAINALQDVEASLREGTSEVGGGTLPTCALPTWLVALAPRSCSPDELARRLRLGAFPLIPRIQKDRLLLDPRTIQESDLPRIPSLLQAALRAEM